MELKDFSISDIKNHLEGVINDKLGELSSLKEQAAAFQKQMADIVIELEPLEGLILHYNPQWAPLFNELKLLAQQTEEEHGNEQQVSQS